MANKSQPKRLLDRTPDDWKSVIIALPIEYRIKVASTVFWDFVELRGGKMGRGSEFFEEIMYKYDYNVDGMIPGDEIAEQLIAVGYTKEWAKKKGRAIDGLQKQVSNRNSKLMEQRRSKYK